MVTTNNSTAPGVCGKRLLPVVIDELARTDPERPWASIPVDDYDLSRGFEDITYAALANAINKLAWLIENIIGRSTSFETIAYLGIPDLRYHMIQMAACKAGYKTLFSSQQNSLEIHVYLMEQTDCAYLFSANGVNVSDILRLRPMKSYVIPEFDDLLDLKDLAPPFPFTKSFEEAARDPYLILHTSGSTGNPKPIIYNHAMIASQDAQELLPDEIHGWKRLCTLHKPGKGVRFIVVTLPFHGISAAFAMIMSVFGGSVFLPGFGHRSVLPDEICGILDYANVTQCIFTPWMMDHILKQPNARSYIEPLTSAMYAGAMLSDETARGWAKWTRIQSAWGATETLAPPQLIGESKDYSYNFFDPIYSGIEFRDIQTSVLNDDGSEDPLYEMVFTISPTTAAVATWHATQGIDLVAAASDTTTIYPELRIGDVWTPHRDPAKAKVAWKFMGRVDDIIILSSGSNYHPGPMEKIIKRIDTVSEVIILGNGRRQPMALIELQEGVDAGSVNEPIWRDHIEPANTKIPGHGRMSKSHVVFLPHGSFIRTLKGNVIRRQTERKFSKVIDQVYETYGDVWQDKGERYASISMSVNLPGVPREKHKEGFEVNVSSQ